MLRSPVGGLFRHVIDLVRGQIGARPSGGHRLRRRTGGDMRHESCNELAAALALGLSRIRCLARSASAMCPRRAMSRTAIRQSRTRHRAWSRRQRRSLCAACGRPRAGRCGSTRRMAAACCFSPRASIGSFYLLLEKLLKRRTDLFLFESAFIERLFRAKIGEPATLARIVPNGVGGDEFADVPLRADATDLLYIGELRTLKGVDLLIDALASSARARNCSHRNDRRRRCPRET